MNIKTNDEQTEYSEILISIKSRDSIHKYVEECLHKLKTGNVKIIGRQYAIMKAFSILEALKEKNEHFDYIIEYNNLTATTPDRRKILEIHIYLKKK
ncbi:conserved Plasmodium protein, unknown function [Plasmodium reichenowi]|uniref:DNA/RNA-binding protein Alba-like domain-containing protein n=1 Tax=Plasmodium reichenowi TaxID=5854 RepID=A0A060RV19_PLARE|nr:hypothetical protein PRSY57_1202200 [Plasmodium reichenowi]KYN95141.1 hypothetical protein PRSY57_1202200 [Plasmodium reichenowi]CDO65311.1 conserved Plasmodium protein, unknown function [Plasmodium reichenowi]SOV80475.1 conserved Plasmodium protein, unknown function [Plasmodium reichenowi]